MQGALNVIDCTAAIENILLEAADRGLGSVYYAAYPTEHRVADLREVFSLPENLRPFAVVSVGYPTEEKANYFADRWSRERVHYEVLS